MDLGILKKYFWGEEVDEKLNLVNIVEFAYLSCIYICFYSVAAPGNFSRVFITKLEYNIIKKKILVLYNFCWHVEMLTRIQKLYKTGHVIISQRVYDTQHVY